LEGADLVAPGETDQAQPLRLPPEQVPTWNVDHLERSYGNNMDELAKAARLDEFFAMDAWLEYPSGKIHISYFGGANRPAARAALFPDPPPECRRVAFSIKAPEDGGPATWQPSSGSIPGFAPEFDQQIGVILGWLRRKSGM
jgi:hypothetical protein